MLSNLFLNAPGLSKGPDMIKFPKCLSSPSVTLVSFWKGKEVMC